MSEQRWWSWMDAAACRGQWRLFHDRDDERQQERVMREARAATVCAVCPVFAQCEEYAATFPCPWSFMAGRSPREWEGRRRGLTVAVAEVTIPRGDHGRVGHQRGCGCAVCQRWALTHAV